MASVGTHSLKKKLFLPVKQRKASSNSCCYVVAVAVVVVVFRLQEYYRGVTTPTGVLQGATGVLPLQCVT